MLDQNELFRRHALGSFRQLALDVTADPAMIQWLNQTENTRWNPNENYARELMELFTLGADRGAYTEDDVRELARASPAGAATGAAELGQHNFRFDAEPPRPRRRRRCSASTGAWNWQDAVRLCLENPKHAVVLRGEAVELLHPGAAVGLRARRRSSAPTSRAATRSGRWSRRSSCTRSSSPARGW